MDTNNSTLKREVLNSFKAELHDALKSNNNALSQKSSTDLDQKCMQFQSYLMTSVKELVTEMSLLCTLSSPPSNLNIPTMLPPSISLLIQTFHSSQHPGGYPYSCAYMVNYISVIRY